MKRILKWLRAPSFKFSWKRAAQTGADWDGDTVMVGKNEYFIYHQKIDELTWPDWFRCLKHQISGHGRVHHFPCVH